VCGCIGGPRGLSDGEPDDVMVVVSSGCGNSADLRQMMIVSPSSDCDDLSLPILI